VLLTLALSAVGQAAAEPAQAPTPEQLATGAVREIISAQAVHKKSHPEVGYACSLERLVETEMLLGVWLTGERVDGYAFKVWCDTKAVPQTNFRASAVPLAKAKGASLTVCTDQTNVPRTIEGDAQACFDKGVPPPR
jgi:hypothetical protein